MKKRLFVASDIPETMAGGFSAYQKTLSINQASWTKEEDYHLTIAFLGYVTGENIQSLEREVAAAASRAASFELHFAKAILAPPGKDARMIWAKLAPSEQYSDLVGKIYANTKPYITELVRTERIPHITLARFREGVIINEKELTQPQLRQKSFVVSEVHLFESKPSQVGAEYTKLTSFKLEGN